MKNNILEEKFMSTDIGLLEKKQVKMLKIKTSSNQVKKITLENITNRFDHAKESIRDGRS